MQLFFIVLHPDSAILLCVFIQNPCNPYFRDILYKTGDLAVQREDGFYSARTCLTIEMAYNNARLICRPETSWIKR